MKINRAFAFACVLCSEFVFADTPFGIDMSYTTVFKESGVPENDTVAKFFRDASDGQPYLKKMAVPQDFFRSYDTENTDKIAILDYQAFWYFGHRVLSAIARTRDGHVVAWGWASKGGHQDEEEVKDEGTLSALLSWKASPLPPGYPKLAGQAGHVYSGYVGVLSTYDNGTIRQIPLIQDDLLKAGDDGKPEPGDLLRYFAR